MLEPSSLPAPETVRLQLRRPSIIARLLLLGIVVYRATLKRILVARGVTCLHYPTCSEYARLSLRKYRVIHAVQRSWARLRDCHPFSGRPYFDPP